MEKEDLYNPVWRELVLGNIQVRLNFLAGNILLSRLKMNLKKNSSEEEVTKAAKDIFELYYKSKDFPSVKKDITALFETKENSIDR
jgi:hypothetical protein